MKTFDPQRDTWGLVDVMGVELFKILNNLTNIFYSYIISSHPISVLFAYLFLCTQLAGYVSNLETMLITLNIGQLVPHVSSRQHYRKGR